MQHQSQCGMLFTVMFPPTNQKWIGTFRICIYIYIYSYVYIYIMYIKTYQNCLITAEYSRCSVIIASDWKNWLVQKNGGLSVASNKCWAEKVVRMSIYSKPNTTTVNPIICESASIDIFWFSPADFRYAESIFLFHVNGSISFEKNPPELGVQTDNTNSPKSTCNIPIRFCCKPHWFMWYSIGKYS